MARWRRRRPEEDGPRRLGEALARIEREAGARPATATASVFEAWEDIAGDVLASHVVPKRVDGEVLVLAADGPIWATQTRRLADDLASKVAERCGWRPVAIEVVAAQR